MRGVVSSVESEWLKLRSQTSTFVAWGIFILLGAGFGALAGWSTHHQWATLHSVQRATFNPLLTSLSGISLGPLALGGLAVGFITNEFSNGCLQGTLLAVPKRARLVVSKIVVLALPVAVLALATNYAAVFAFNATIRLTGERVALGSAIVNRSLLLGALYMALAVIFAFAMGLVIRRTALAVSLFIGFYLVIPIIVQLFPWHWLHAVMPYMLGSLGGSMMGIATPGTGLNVWVATGLLGLYTGTLATLGVLKLQRTSL